MRRRRLPSGRILDIYEPGDYICSGCGVLVTPASEHNCGRA